MKTTRTKMKIDGLKSKVNVIVEEYKDFSEFKKAQDERPVQYTARSVPVREITNDSDKKCDSFEDATDLLIHGYSENVEKMVSKVNMLHKTGLAKKTKRYSDVVGYAPIVPNAILGLPNSMMNQKRVRVNSKVITVVYAPDVPWYVSPSEVLDYGCKVIAYIMNLEKQGYRVRVEYLSSNADDTTHPKNQNILRIPLKSENNPVNVKRLAFALTHAAMQRYMVFDWLERLPNSAELYGMGYSLMACEDRPKIVVRNTLSNNEYLVWHGADLDQVFNGLD